MTSKTTLALKLYYGATEKQIKEFWSMRERDMGIGVRCLERQSVG